MVRSVRIKTYRFPNSVLTSDDTGAGNFETYSERPLNGRLQCIQWIPGTNLATGSLTIFESGTNTVLYNMHSGTVFGHHLGTTETVFPRASTVSTQDYSLSGANTSEYAEICLNSVLRVVGSNIGSSKASGAGGYSLSGLNIVYI